MCETGCSQGEAVRIPTMSQIWKALVGNAEHRVLIRYRVVP